MNPAILRKQIDQEPRPSGMSIHSWRVIKKTKFQSLMKQNSLDSK